MPREFLITCLIIAAGLEAPVVANGEFKVLITEEEPVLGEKAVAELRDKAENGTTWEQFSLGRRFRDGKGVKQDDHEAVYWFRKAADLGDGLALLALGSMAEKGRGCRRDNVEAYVCYRLSAKMSPRWGGDAAAETLKGALSPVQLAEAEEQIAEWEESHSNDVPPPSMSE